LEAKQQATWQLQRFAAAGNHKNRERKGGGHDAGTETLESTGENWHRTVLFSKGKRHSLEEEAT
jgi:hypothetical protein